MSMKQTKVVMYTELTVATRLRNIVKTGALPKTH